jgi:hypothetical protein
MIKDKSCKINFNNAVRVVLIPTREEYRAAGLSDVMWWDDSDYKSFKDSALTELRNLVQKRGKMDTKTALSILYQPNPNNIDEILEDFNSEINLNTSDAVDSHSVINGLDSCKKQSIVKLRKNRYDVATIGLKREGESFLKLKRDKTNHKEIEGEKVLSSSWSTSSANPLLASR